MLLTVGSRKFSIEEVLQVASGEARVSVWDEPSYRSRLERGAEFLTAQWKAGNYVYGVTSGYGDSGKVAVPNELVEELPAQLVRFHGCGLGAYLPEDIARAVVLARLIALARGFSGVRPELLEQLALLLEHRITPLIPEEGSVGASGDLTPLSYVAAALTGERDVIYKGQRVPARAALEDAGMTPLKLRPKEGLSLMNGTSAMTAIACFAVHRAQYLLKLACRISAITVEALGGNAEHYDEQLFALKPFTGQQQAAAWIRKDLGAKRSYGSGHQDRYSLRCAPHVLGVLGDALPWVRQFVETELNSVNDNPVVLVDEGRIVHGGHFYGGHIAFAMDSLKSAVANVADLLDRQLALLVDPATSNGLPRNLSGAAEGRKAINHGLKAVQIASSAWTAEALKHCMPASVFSRSTECHNQDKVSMGTIAARDCQRALTLTEQVAAACLVAGVQALRLRERQGELLRHSLTGGIRSVLEQADRCFEPIDEDRELDADLQRVLLGIHEQTWDCPRQPS